MKNTPLIIEHYLKEILSPEDAAKVKINMKVTHSGIQTGGYCTSHAQSSALYGAPPAETNSDFAHELQWTAKQAKRAKEVLGVADDSFIGKRLNKIKEAVDIDTRRVYFNDPSLFHRYAELPTDSNVGMVAKGDGLLETNNPVIAESSYLQDHIDPNQEHVHISEEHYLLLQARHEARKIYREQSAKKYAKKIKRKLRNWLKQHKNKKNIERRKCKEIGVC